MNQKYCIYCGYLMDEEGNCTNDPHMCEKTEISFCPKCGQGRQQKKVIFCLSCGLTFDDALQKHNEEKEKLRTAKEKEEIELNNRLQEHKEDLHKALVENLDVSTQQPNVDKIALEKTVVILNSGELSEFEKTLGSDETKIGVEIKNPFEHLVLSEQTLDLDVKWEDINLKQHEQKQKTPLLQKIMLAICVANLVATIYLISLILIR